MSQNLTKQQESSPSLPARSSVASVSAAPAVAANEDLDPLRWLDHMQDVLTQERKAIAALDATALMNLTEEKSALVERLTDIIRQANVNQPSESTANAGHRHALRSAAIRMLASAEANRLLIAHAIEAIAETRGLQKSAGTYDARARVKSLAPSRLGTAL